MILTIGGIKGGSGKSLLAISMVVLRSSDNKKVLFIDADDQKTSSDWVRHRQNLEIKTQWDTKILTSKSVRTEILKVINDYDDIIIDCGGRDTDSLRFALSVTQKLVVPFRAAAADIWTVTKVSKLVKEAKELNPLLTSYSVLNATKPRNIKSVQAKDLLSQISELELIPVSIGDRNAFSDIIDNGLSVTESRLDDKAISEITQLYNYIYR